MADFGLAVTEALQHDRAGEVAGTPTYMAPEQVRGEAHRLDGRTDIWALGVILYQGLTGRLPFAARGPHALFDEILHRDPKPPRQIDDAMPRELERICLKCLVQADDRSLRRRRRTSPTTCGTGWLASAHDPATAAARGGLAPRRAQGLRAFDGDDADFFLALLPGPRGRDGLPESIRFWKSRIEGRDDDRDLRAWACSTGRPAAASRRWSGPASCRCSARRSGRSTSRPRGTDRGAALGRRCGGSSRLPAGATWSRCGRCSGTAGRRPADGKVLRPRPVRAMAPCPPGRARGRARRALRHCDGVASRRCSSSATTSGWRSRASSGRSRSRCVEGVNSAAVELFDPGHARRVLVEFGPGLRPAPRQAGRPGADATGSSTRPSGPCAGPDGRVIPPSASASSPRWSGAALDARDAPRPRGGRGIGVTFLRRPSTRRTSPPSHRLHREAAQAVLQDRCSPRRLGPPRPDALGPRAERGGRLWRPPRGLRRVDPHPRPRAPDDHPRPIGRTRPSRSIGGHSRRRRDLYQLAHDFLITPIRQWVERQARTTRAGTGPDPAGDDHGRVVGRPGPQRLASPLEWMGILWHSPGRAPGRPTSGG